MAKRLILLAVLVTSTFAVADTSAEYKGEFTMVQMSSPECKNVFQVLNYNLRATLMGFNGRTFVLSFSHPDKAGFFHGQNIVGLYGYNDDFQVEKTLVLGSRKYEILMRGLVNRKVLFGDAFVSVFAVNPPTEDPICTTAAEISGWN